MDNFPEEADEMPRSPGIVGEARASGQRDLQQLPLLATTGNDMSSKESVDMPMHAITNPLVHRVCSQTMRKKCTWCISTSSSFGNGWCC